MYFCHLVYNYGLQCLRAENSHIGTTEKARNSGDDVMALNKSYDEVTVDSYETEGDKYLEIIIIIIIIQFIFRPI